MKFWLVQKAATRFYELLTACEREGPQLITKRGAEIAVLIPVEEWPRLSAARPRLKSLLLAKEARCGDLRISPRDKARHRAAPDF